MEAVSLNPKLVLSNIQLIMEKQYNFRDNHKNLILENKTLIDKFVTLHIEFENGLHSKVKNRTAYILISLGLVVKKK